MQVSLPSVVVSTSARDMLTACLRRVDANGRVGKEGREFATQPIPLSWPCPTGLWNGTALWSRWKAPGSIGNPSIMCSLVRSRYSSGNAQDARSRPGKKTDKRDAAWIAELLYGLIRLQD